MKRILIVDDELDMLSAVRSILEDEGYQVETAHDGTDALEMLARGTRPDLVLSDVMMPRLSGHELVNRMRRDRALKEIPVVLMSGVNPSISRTEGRWDDFLKKPFTLDDLIRVVGKQLR